MWSIDELQDVWKLASSLHNGQKYGGQAKGQQVEYINHIGSVTFEILAAISIERNMNASLAIKCAILHDSIEDTDFLYQNVKEKFGQQVADGVLALTKNDDLEDKNQKMHDSLARIKQQAKEVWAVKMADRICNLQKPPFNWPNKKKQAYRKEAMLILQELKEGNAYLAKRLQQKIEDYKQYIS